MLFKKIQFMCKKTSQQKDNLKQYAQFIQIVFALLFRLYFVTIIDFEQISHIALLFFC